MPFGAQAPPATWHSIMNQAAEILVHISAPSSAQDDARYRQQALAFLQFTASKTHDMTPDEEGRRKDSVRQDRQQFVEHLPSSAVSPLFTTSDHATRAKVLLQDDGLTSPIVHVSRTPAVQVATTPAALSARAALLRRPRTAPAAIPNTPLSGYSLPRSKSDSWETPPSVVPDSQPSHSSLKRAFEEAVASTMPGDHSEVPLVKRQQMYHIGFHGPHSDGTNTISGHGEPRGEVTGRAEQHSTEDSIEGMQISELSSSQSLPSRASQNSNKSSSSIPPSTPAQPPSSSSGSSSQQEEKWYQIRAPAPPTGQGDIQTHLTRSLTTITRVVPLAEYFKPRTQTREIRALERGHWHFCIPIEWPAERKTKFWSFIEKFVTEGRAGWGVGIERLLTRAKPATQDSNAQDQNSNDSTRGVLKEEVSMYCWGEVVGEIWLVLWLGTDRKIVGLGSEWIDGSGEMVITME